jgi:hypothetical protein
VEELPDPQQHIHGLVIINEPNTWLINLMTREARHQVDGGPTFNCRLPIFLDGAMEPDSKSNSADDLVELEFGRELLWFTKKGAQSKTGPTLKGNKTQAYSVDVGDSKLFLFTNGTPEKPVALTRERGKEKDIYWYSDFENLPFDPRLFSKPEAVKIQD